MGSVNPDPAFWPDRTVLLTGHTGFKGGWLAHWLAMLGARVHGLALAPATSPNLFEVAEVGAILASHDIVDIRDGDGVRGVFARVKPDIVLHLAAQPLVRDGYRDPVGTFATNVLGTAHVLEAARNAGSVRAIVSVTTDKCYDNREWVWPYRETDPLGGRDPYAASKACAEIVSAAYRDSFLLERGIGLATARAGNVIGGGDWSPARLLPDYLAAHERGETLKIRSPHAVRPWQHVLEPLVGYLILAERLFADAKRFSGAFNFGPGDQDCVAVEQILRLLSSLHVGVDWQIEGTGHVHEATLLKLDSSKAQAVLGWKPRWSLRDALSATLEWETQRRDGSAGTGPCRAQIARFEACADAVG